LRRALLTNEELSRPSEWASYVDPFGDWHEDPCNELVAEEVHARERREGDDS
jgi:hypothetical protein